MCLPMLASADATETGGNTAQNESLYGEWWLVGWNDGGTAFEADTNYVSKSKKNLIIVIPREGYVKAYSMVNEIFVGLLTLNGNEMIFEGEHRGLSTCVNCDVMENLFFEDHICDIKSYQLDGNLLRLYYTDNDYFVFTSDTNGTVDDYRPFVEDGKVWAVKVGSDTLPIEEWIEYYYFDGDTIIDGRTAKRMVGDRISYGQYTTGEYIGAWYEQDKKVYFAFRGKQQFELIYDFTLSTDDSIFHHGYTWVLNKVSEGTLGFKGRYYDFSLGCWHDNVITARWFEGVGSRTYPWLYRNMSEGPVTLLACSVGDEVIYYNSDEGNPYFIGARKQRIDFTHTIKIKPKARKRSEAAQSLYGEYNDLLLGIRLDPLDDAYQVCITDEAGKAVYEKTVNAGSIVGLNIDIAAYAAGRYTVTVENSQEAFTGQFEAQATGIEEAKSKRPEQTGSIYNLQGQRVSTLQKGLNIVNGQKVYVR